MACKGWENGCNCRNCKRLHQILMTPEINTEEDIKNAQQRKWTPQGHIGQGKGEQRKKDKKDK